MSDINEMIKEASSLTVKIRKDVERLSQIYGFLIREVNRDFHTELAQQNGKIEGLEDFYSLLLFSKRNGTNVLSCRRIFEKLKDIKQFTSVEEKVEEFKDGEDKELTDAIEEALE